VAVSKQSKKKPKAKDKPARKAAVKAKPAAKAHPEKKADKGKSKPAPAAAKHPAAPVKGAPAKAAPPVPPGKAPAKGEAGKAVVPVKGKAGKGDGTDAPAAPVKEKRKGSKRSASRRGDYPPGELLLPGGPQGPDEILYLLRGCVAAERPAIEAGVTEIVTKQSLPESDRPELTDFGQGMSKRFLTGTIEPLLPIRPKQTRDFPGVVERARHRRREIGAFLRGLDLGHTETSHMDSHGEDSLEKLMQWAARLENLVEADEPASADYAQFHKGLDQLDNQTEALIVDVENTLRRLRDRVRPQRG
jgi:hypothetical protein